MSSKHYQQLIQQVEKLTGKLNERYRTHLQCRAECSGCCHHHLSVFPVEAATITSAIQALPQATRERIHQQAEAVKKSEARLENVVCPLLVDDHCSIYEARPLICRTQGLPLLFEAEDGQQEVDFCPLNFTSDDAIAELDDEHLIPLDALNIKLALVNLEYCRALESDANQRVKIADLCNPPSSV
jgi:uncharacterized protein